MYLYSEIVFSHKKEIQTLGTTRMDLEGILLSEMSYRGDKYCVILHVESIKNKTRNHFWRDQRWMAGGGKWGEEIG